MSLVMNFSHPIFLKSLSFLKIVSSQTPASEMCHNCMQDSAARIECMIAKTDNFLMEGSQIGYFHDLFTNIIFIPPVDSMATLLQSFIEPIHLLDTC